MKIKSTIARRGFVARVTIPDELWRGMFRHELDDEWQRKMCRCPAGADASGSDSYADREEWAEFPTEALARQWIAAVSAELESMAQRVRELDEKRRQEDDER